MNVNKKIDFLLNSMNAHIGHMRHVENERLTCNSIYIVVVAGFLAFVSSVDDFIISAFILICLIVLGLVVILLSKRWDKVFKLHSCYVKKYERFLRSNLLSTEESQYLSSYPVRMPRQTSGWRHPFTNVRTSTFFFLFQVILITIIIAVFVYTVCCKK